MAMLNPYTPNMLLSNLHDLAQRAMKFRGV